MREAASACAAGYDDDELWSIPRRSRARFLTADLRTAGPASWADSATWPNDKGEHPVSGICFLEAQAFANWSNRISCNSRWTRGEAGLIYPWGDAFDVAKCNSSESGIGATGEITRFESGSSPFDCCDMAGNVWEFVSGFKTRADWCVLRGGSYKNTSSEVHSYLRLINVPKTHRPSDFGFRLAQVESTDTVASQS